MENDKFKRHVAEKIKIANILSGKFVHENEKDTSFLQVGDRKIFRVQLIAAVTFIEKVGSITNFLLDDGTGNISARFFEEDNKLKEIMIGDIVLFVARPRNYNNQIYLSTEVWKKTTADWLKVRSLQLKDELIESKIEEKEKTEIKVEENQAEEKDIAKVETTEEIQNSEEKVVVNELSESNKIVNENKPEEILNLAEEDEMAPLLPFEKILALIKEIDTGEGVLMEEIIEKSSLQDTEQVLNKMLEKGDIFQIQPGKVKIL